MAREDDFVTNTSGNTPFDEVLDAAMMRRTVLRGGVLGAAAFFAGGSAFASAAAAASPKKPLLGTWPAIATSSADTVSVPLGYTAQPFIPWGDPIVPSGPAFVSDASNSAADQEQQVGMGHDGIHFFPFHNGAGSSAAGLLVLNHEYTVDAQLFPDGRSNWDAEKTRKSQAAHGVTVVHIERDAVGNWNTVESNYPRRITANTPTVLTGPAAGHRLVQTAADPAGTTPLGILNQCGNGYTPWGTYLATEENFNGYFHETSGGTAEGISSEQAAINDRYGIARTGFGYLWATTDERFRADLNPQEPNRFGWIVEIDPMAPSSAPAKRTALGRFKHEGAAFTTGRGGRAVVYMGDDQRFDYIYKFVGARNWNSELAKGRSPLDDGTLYAARFDADGTGTWLPLVHGQGPLTAENGYNDQGDVLVKARLAADALGATPMDRPEWTTVHPKTGEVFCTLTNNTARTEPNAANPRAGNPWGHIIRWLEKNPVDETFEWDIFLLAGPGDGVDGSTISSEDQFGSPDGLWIDDNDRMWIQTDGSQPDGSNNQMLVADPATGEIKRFLVGPVNCEVTGVTATPDHRTFFINIQHPGDRGPTSNPTLTSTWPEGPGAGRPRPATVVVQRADGGVVGT